MVEVGFQVVSAFDSRIHETRAVSAERLEEGACIAAVPGARPLVGRVKRPKSAVRPEIGAIPEIHQSENAMLNSVHPGRRIAIQKPELLKPLESPVREIDLDAVWIEDPPVEIA
jgi:hypothetical protein